MGLMLASTQHEAVGIPDRRRALGLTQGQLAMRADCSRASVALIESGYRPRRSEVLARIEAVLDHPSKSSAPAGNGGAATSSAGGAASGAGSA
ncbi:MAG: helix-turn-helix domain-containing protein [Thermoleophilaceae bacterium]